MAVLACAVAAAAVFLGFVQFGSDAIFRAAGSARSLPAHLPRGTGTAIYGAIARVAPAPYVNAMLARSALDRGDPATAEQFASRLPTSAARSELLGRAAQARGDHRAAQRYFLEADDIFAIDGEVQALAKTDPPAAYDLERRLKDRLQATGTHPDAVAEAYWRLGVLAIHQGRPRLALAQYRKAIALSPLSSKYLIAAGFQSFDLGRFPESRRYFSRAISVDPCSADALAGEGMIALHFGNRAAAQAYAARSAACDPAAPALQTLRSRLQ